MFGLKTHKCCFELANTCNFVYSYRWVKLISEGLCAYHHRSKRKESRIPKRWCFSKTSLCSLLCWKLPVLCTKYQSQDREYFQVHHADWCLGSWLHCNRHQEASQTRGIIGLESTGQHSTAKKWIEHADCQRGRSQGRELKDQIPCRHLQRHLKHRHDDLNLLADHLLEELLQIQEDHLS